jgi:nicotinamidase-related amidase
MATALVVIDVQQGLFSEAEVYRGDEVLAAIRALQDRARAAGLPVLHVQHDGGPGDSLARGSVGFAIHDEVAPLTGEEIVVKTRCDAFFRTELDAKLKARGIERLVMAGLQTEYCIDTSVRSAMSHGYKVVLASDAHSTFDSPDLKAADITAHHNRVLRSFAEIVPAAEIAL